MTAQIEIPEAFPVAGEVAGKRVVITGAGRGLGALLAHAFSAAGAAVLLVARTERDLKAVAGHAPFAWGKTVADAVEHADILEYIARLAFRSRIWPPAAAQRADQTVHSLRRANPL